MILALKEKFLSTLDPSVVYVCLAVLVILLVITIIKKAFKLAIVVVLIAGLTYAVIPAAKNFQENYSLTKDKDGAIVVKVEGNEFKFGGKNDEQVKNININREKDGSYTLNLQYNDSSAVINVPGYMRKPIIDYIKDANIKYKLVE